MRRREYLATVGAGAATVLAGCSGSDGGSGDGGSDDANSGDANSGGGGSDDGGSGGGSGDANSGDGGAGGGNKSLEILSHEWYQEEYQAGVRGRVKNVSGRELDYAEVEAVFLDSSGAQIGSSIDNTNGLADGREWRFDVLYLDTNSEEVARYEITAGTTL